ncbi:MAG: hypothetical protein V3S69_07920 [Dehalococcoidales bacterium]
MRAMLQELPVMVKRDTAVVLPVALAVYPTRELSPCFWVTVAELQRAGFTMVEGYTSNNEVQILKDRFTNIGE